MCDSIPLISEYLLRQGFQYVLTGFMQSDPLEKRFGVYRQMSGSNYFLGVKQVYENEQKLKLCNLLKHSGLSVRDINLTLDSHSDNEYALIETAIDNYILSLDTKLSLNKHELNIICYVGGYVSYTLLKSSKCSACEILLLCEGTLPEFDLSGEENATAFLTLMSRGGLRIPSDAVYVICCWCYTIFVHLKQEHNWALFVKESSPATVFVSIVKLKLPGNCDIYSTSCCLNGHRFAIYLDDIIRRFFNALMSGYVKQMKSPTSSCAQPKIRKLQSRN
jgi:hypothetical protein